MQRRPSGEPGFLPNIAIMRADFNPALTTRVLSIGSLGARSRIVLPDPRRKALVGIPNGRNCCLDDYHLSVLRRALP